ncbi:MULTISPECIES: hypothetical protein [unclassified Bradyrhizobium]|uniref:hypothetical protein n=1 Tax=unclassified Bradyrhizobium TaxID=2631580 RepID=UPI002916CE68|nr:MULTISPECIES: hypothetical protein [unclassified Bradyrhizobium]
MDTSLVIQMPRIDHFWTNTVFYLYRLNPRTGIIDASPSGTGCFVQRPSRLTGLSHMYAISNWNVTQDGGGSIIRINKPYGSTFNIELNPEDWIFDPKGDDLSAVDVTDHLFGNFDEVWVVDEENDFVSQSKFDDLRIGVGEDTVMLGMFSGHHGGDRNIPSARFGNISMLPSDKALVQQPNGVRRPSYLVDIRSRGGYSGSPVFVYRTLAGDLRRGARLWPADAENHLFALLGIHCAQFRERIEVRKATSAEAAGDPILENDTLYIEGGTTVVIPAWRISELLDRPEFEATRADRDQKRRIAWERLPGAK